MPSTLFNEAISILNTDSASAGYINALDQPNKLATAKKAGDKLKSLLITAKRYHLSNDFTRMASVYGFNVSDVLSNFLNVAKPPFGQMWIEWPV